jgi:hypothetical protein
MSNKGLYSIFENYKPEKDTFDWDISLGDVVFLAWTGLFYFILIFIIEFLK